MDRARRHHRTPAADPGGPRPNAPGAADCSHAQPTRRKSRIGPAMFRSTSAATPVSPVIRGRAVALDAHDAETNREAPPASSSTAGSFHGEPPPAAAVQRETWNHVAARLRPGPSAALAARAPRGRRAEVRLRADCIATVRNTPLDPGDRERPDPLPAPRVLGQGLQHRYSASGVSLKQVCRSTPVALRHWHAQLLRESRVSASHWPRAASAKSFLGPTTRRISHAPLSGRTRMTVYQMPLCGHLSRSGFFGKQILTLPNHWLAYGRLLNLDRWTAGPNRAPTSHLASPPVPHPRLADGAGSASTLRWAVSESTVPFLPSERWPS